MCGERGCGRSGGRCRLGRAGVCGSNVQFQEAEPVVSSIKEGIEPVWVTVWTEEAVCRGWRF